MCQGWKWEKCRYGILPFSPLSPSPFILFYPFFFISPPVPDVPSPPTECILHDVYESAVTTWTDKRFTLRENQAVRDSAISKVFRASCIHCDRYNPATYRYKVHVSQKIKCRCMGIPSHAGSLPALICMCVPCPCAWQTVRFYYGVWNIGNPLLEVEPTGQRDQSINQSRYF